ncbi:MAG: GNAT family N-acetyltransferase [Candidatus Izemoplasmatales bacterium]
MIQIRLEEEKDYFLVEKITKEAFDGLHGPGCDEHLIVHKLRKSACFIPNLSYVLEKDGQVIGHIVFSKAKVIGDEEYEVISFGPVSIIKNEQGKGYGTKLIQYGIDQAKQLGYKAIVIYGHPEYYPRFGFVNAEKFQITTKDGQNFNAFMALELYEGALDSIKGKFYEDKVFQVDSSELEAFNLKFL